jgi:hypothetical protein
MHDEDESRNGASWGIRVALLFAVLGFINAAISAGVTFYLNSGAGVNNKLIHNWSKNVIWVWPTSVMMMAAESTNRLLGGVILMASMVLNACLYAIVGLLVGALFQKIVNSHRYPIRHNE